MILVTGATGTFGSEVARLLRDKGADFSVLVRDRDRALEKLAGAGVGPDQIRIGDFDDPESVRRALAGIERVFVTCVEDARMLERQRAFLEAARGSELRHIVRISAIGADPASERVLDRWHGELEREVEQLGIGFCHVRSQFCSTNLMWAGTLVRWMKQLPLPFGDAGVSVADTRDVSAVAVEALLDDRHQGRTYLVTGPVAMTGADLAATLSEVVGAEVQYQPCRIEDVRRMQSMANKDSWIIDARMAIYDHFARGHGAIVSQDVERITGRPARHFREFARAYASWFGGEPPPT